MSSVNLRYPAEQAPAAEEREAPPAAPTRRGNGTIVALLAVIAVILAAGALRATTLVTMPLAFAFFVAVVMYPLEQALADRLPRRLQWLAVLLTMLLIVSVAAAAVALISLALVPVTTRAPGYVDMLQQQIDGLRSWTSAHGVALPADFDLAGTVMSSGAQSVIWGLTSAGEVLVFLLLVFFFTLLMLAEASAWRRKTQAALRGRHTAAVLDTVGEIAHKVRRFFMVRSFVSLIAALTQGGWLWLMGVDFAPFWAVLIFFLNYLPNLGSIVVGTLATLLAFVQYGPGWAALVAVGLTGIDQLLGNFLDPKLQGRSLNVSSLVVLIAVIFWGWMWGMGGALLAVPLTVTIILACAHVPALEPIAVLLSGGPRRTPTRPAERVCATLPFCRPGRHNRPLAGEDEGSHGRWRRTDRGRLGHDVVSRPPDRGRRRRAGDPERTGRHPEGCRRSVRGRVRARTQPVARRRPGPAGDPLGHDHLAAGLARSAVLPLPRRRRRTRRGAAPAYDRCGPPDPFRARPVADRGGRRA